jgi:hypothetical protein
MVGASSVAGYGSGPQMDKFQDLKIVGFEERSVRPSNRAAGLRQMPLLLSSTAPPGWASLLEAKCERNWSQNKRRSISVGGVYIYVDCVPEELNAILQDLKPMVATTNGEYREVLARQEHFRDQADKEAGAEKARLEYIKKNLNFD